MTSRTSSSENQAIEVFFSYACEDEKLRNELAKHLKVLERQGEITAWYDREITAGTEWKGQIDKHLESAKVILLLVSADFMASDYCYDVELKRAMERHESKKACVIPVILREVVWKRAPFGKLQALPKNEEPVTNWANRDQAFADIVRGISQVVKELQEPEELEKSGSLSSKPQTVQEEKRLEELYQLYVPAKYQEWGEAPPDRELFGRNEDLARLKDWILQHNCNLVALLGEGGIGKTALAVKLVEQIQGEFEYFMWQSFFPGLKPPDIKDFLSNTIKFLSNQQETDLPKTLDGSLSRLMHYLHQHRCLLVVDNVETILRRGIAGEYKEEYKDYGEFFNRVGNGRHHSCLILTGRELPQKVYELCANPAYVQQRLTLVEGLSPLEGRKVFKILEKQEIFGSVSFVGDENDWKIVIQHYGGNPKALEIVAGNVGQFYQGNLHKLTEELKTGKLIFREMSDLLNRQFKRLSNEEKVIMYWLAINRQPVSLEELKEDITPRIHQQRDFLSAMYSLLKRSLIEKVEKSLSPLRRALTQEVSLRYTLQPVVMEYVTNLFIERIVEEISSAREITLFNSHAVMKAQAKDYVMDAQRYFILTPIQEKLLENLGNLNQVENQLCRILSKLQDESQQEPGYAAGNILNLLIHMDANLRGYDFSNLKVWQAYLRGADLRDVNFAHSELTNSIFTLNFGSIISLAFSPDNRLIATGDTLCQVRLWSAVDGKELSVCEGHVDWVRSVAFSPDSQILVSGSADRTLRLWNVRTGECLNTLRGHSNRIWSVAFSPNGRTIASGSQDKTVKLWDINSDKCLKTLEGHSKWVQSVAFNIDGRILASGSEDKTVKLWNVDTGTCLKTLQDHCDWVQAVAFSPDCETVASGSEDRMIKLWSIDTGKCLKTLRGHTDWVLSIDFNFDGQILASGSEDQTVKLWDVETSSCLKTLQGHTRRVRWVAFSPDGQLLASGSDDQTVRIWEVSTGRCTATARGYTNRPWSVAFNPDGQTVASANEDHTVRVWDVRTGKCLKSLEGHNNWVRSVAFSPDGQTLASGSADSTVRLWEVSNGRCQKVLQLHTDRVRSVAFSPNGQILASCSDDTTARLWEVSTGRCQKVLQLHTDRVRSVAFSPNGQILASGSSDKTVKLWDVSTGNCLKSLEGHNNWIRSVAFSPDGQTVASGSTDKTVKLWDVSTGKCLKTCQGHKNWVRSVAFSPDGQTLASGSADETIKLWEVRTGECFSTLHVESEGFTTPAISVSPRDLRKNKIPLLQPLLSGFNRLIGKLFKRKSPTSPDGEFVFQGYTNLVLSVTFSPDGKTLASGSADEKVKLWNIRTGKCLRTMRAERPYEGMNIKGVTGLTEAQKNTLIALGAVEDVE